MDWYQEGESVKNRVICKHVHAHAVALRRVACGGVVAFPWAVWASVEATTNTASTGPDLTGVGRVLGMMLFAYLALKWFNRKKDRNEDEPRGFLGLPVKPWVVWLVVIGGLGLLMVRSG